MVFMAGGEGDHKASFQRQWGAVLMGVAATPSYKEGAYCTQVEREFGHSDQKCFDDYDLYSWLYCYHCLLSRCIDRNGGLRSCPQNKMSQFHYLQCGGMPLCKRHSIYNFSHISNNNKIPKD